MPAPPPDVAAYLAAQPPANRAALERLRAQILAASPGSTEMISYQMPAFAHEGRAFLWIGGFRHHCAIYPGTIRFAPNDPLPAARVKALARGLLARERSRAAKARPKTKARTKAKPSTRPPTAKKARGRARAPR